MKFIISSAELLKQLHILNSLGSNNNTLPILDHFLFVLQTYHYFFLRNLEVTLKLSFKEDYGEMAGPANMITEQPLTFK